ncbi:MAG: MBL fold metallo-hydrolase [Acidobacteriaceae bacterium]
MPFTLHQIEIPGLAQYSYVIASEGRAVIIDPIRDYDRYTEYLAAHSLTLTHILETHIHADFASGAPALAAVTNAELAFSAYDAGELYEYAMPHRPLHNGDRIAVGRLTIEALHTPGHTPEHLSFLLYDNDHSTTAPIAIFSGDFIFPGSLGRPDLLGEDAKVGLAHQLYKSLHQRIAHLPDHLRIYPGHGAGSFCGASIGAQAHSTLGQERATTALYRLNEEDFVRHILDSVPAMPAYYPRMKQLNSAGATSVATLPGNIPLTPAQVRDLAQNQSAILLDLRNPEDFAAAHIPGAISLGAGPSLSLWAGWLLDAKLPIVLVNNSGDDEPSRRALTRVGLDNIAGYLTGGMLAWISSNLPTATITLLNSVQLQARLDLTQPILLDVRNPSEWNAGHLPNARHIMLGDLPHQLETLPKDQPIITVCQGGYRASAAASLLAKAGFANVCTLEGGMNAWSTQQTTH